MSIDYDSNIPIYRLPTTTGMSLPMQTQRLDPVEMMASDQVPDRHTFYALFWITEGTGQHHIDFEDYEIRPNSLFLMRPGQTHFFVPASPINGFNFFFKEDWLHLDNISVQASKLFYQVEQRPALYPEPGKAASLTQCFETIFEEFSASNLGRAEALQSLFQLLLIHIQRIYQHTVADGKPTAETHLSSEFYHLVGKNFASSHRLADYAEQLGVSTGYLNRKVKAATGSPASHFIRQRILIEAKRLLIHTELPAAEIAHQIGFTDSSYFGRFFKRETSLTPVDFRRSWYEKYQNRAL